MDASMISQMKALEDENRRLKKMFAEMSMQAELLKEALGKKVNRPSIARKANACICRGSSPGPFRQIASQSPFGRRMAANAVARRGIGIAPACRTFEVSESCYRCSPKLSGENEEIGGLLIGLTSARKTWGGAT
jgi:putative transposase